MKEIIEVNPQQGQYSVNFFKNLCFLNQAQKRGFTHIQLPSGEKTVTFEMEEFRRILRHGNLGLYNEVVHPLKEEGDIFVRETDEDMKQIVSEMTEGTKTP